jgi:lysophospholipase L1-like esterase
MRRSISERNPLAATLELLAPAPEPLPDQALVPVRAVSLSGGGVLDVPAQDAGSFDRPIERHTLTSKRQAVRRLVAEHEHECDAGRERTILCFGDSNTWGYPPGGDKRFPRTVRWPGTLQRLLGEGYHVIEEGLKGRTATVEHPWVEGRNGRPYLLPCCRSHAPLDLVIIYLGTNDLADRYHLSPADIAQACASLVRVVQAADCGHEPGPPAVLLVCPPPLRASGPDAAKYETVAAKSRALGALFADAAEAVGAQLLDLDGVVSYSDEDPMHLDADGHRALAEAVEPHARRLVPGSPLSVL